jgi:hypothetical protein
MPFPITPTNGQVSVQNGISYTYASATNSWTRNQISQASITMTIDTFTGNGSTIVFSLSITPTSKELMTVNIDGVLQQASAYSLSGNILTLTGIPINGAIIEVKTINAPPTTVLTGLVYDSFTGDGNTTAFTLSSTPTNRNFTLVTVGGVVQQKTTYAVASTTLTFSTAPLFSSPIEVITFGPAMISTLAAGGDTQIQFSSGNVLTASSNLTFNTETNTFATANISSVGNITATGNISVGNITATGTVNASNFVGNGSQLTSIATAVSVTANAQPNITSIGSLIGLTVSGNATINGWLTLQESTEVLNTKAGSNGIVIHDLSTGSTFYHTVPISSFTANFTNVPTTENRTIVVALLIVQGATPYIPATVQIDGVAQVIRWSNSTAPTGTASKTDIIAFTLLRVSGGWNVYGQYSNYG